MRNTDDINLSHKLNDIEGIVIIDEIELHLHSKLQREVLPELIALFPRIQFIITSSFTVIPCFWHERKIHGRLIWYNRNAIREKVSTEGIFRIWKCVPLLYRNWKFQETLKKMIDAKHEKPLIITEGSTDWKHMKAAYNELIHDSRCKEWLSELDFEFFGIWAREWKDGGRY